MKRLLETKFAGVLTAVDDSNLLYFLSMLGEILHDIDYFVKDERLAQLCLEVVSRIDYQCTRFFGQNVPIAQEWSYYSSQHHGRLEVRTRFGVGYAVDFAGFLVSSNTCPPLDSKLEQLFRLSSPSKGSDPPSIYKQCLYLAYMLLCACKTRGILDLKFSQVLSTISVADARPNNLTVFYLPASRPRQVTPWTAFLCNWEKSIEFQNYRDFDYTLVDVVNNFIDAGASLEEKTLFQLTLSGYTSSGYCAALLTANILKLEDHYVICEVNLAHVLSQIRQMYYLRYGTTFDIKNAHPSTTCLVRPILVKLQAWEKSKAVEIIDEQASLHLAGKFRKARLAMHESDFDCTMPRYSCDEEREEFAIPDTDERTLDSYEAAHRGYKECIADLKQQIQEISERKDVRFVDPELILKQRGYLRDKDDPMVLAQHQDIIRAGREYMKAIKASEVGEDWAPADKKARMNED